MASSSSSLLAKYPYPSEVNVGNFVPVKLSRTNYSVWKPLMFRLIKTYDLLGFIDPDISEEIKNNMWWKRSDALLGSWILGTLEEDLLPDVVDLETAKDIWLALEEILTPKEYQDLQVRSSSVYQTLYKAAVVGDWNSAMKFVIERPEAVRAPITGNLETALTVAVKSLQGINLVKELVKLMTAEDLALENCNGETALHEAAAVGNIEAAKLLVNKNPDLPNHCDFDGTIPIHRAARYRQKDMVLYLLDVIKEDGATRPFEGDLGVTFVHDLITIDLYDVALRMVGRYPELASAKDSPLKALALKRSAFPSGACLNFWQRLMYSYVPMKLENFANNVRGGDVENPTNSFISGPTNGLISVRQKLHEVFWEGIEILVPHYIKDIRRAKLIHHQALQLVKTLCVKIYLKTDLSEAFTILKPTLMLAARVGNHEVIEEIFDTFPNVVYLTNEMKQTVFHVAIMNRQENVFNLIYQFNEKLRPEIVTMSDVRHNNCLHMAGCLDSEQKLNIRASAAGAALQMQRELQWFKEMEKLTLPQGKERKNNEGKTPAMLFRETHEELVKEGEQLMKDTANSYIIVAALIATIVFAAAITVPGGNNGKSGLPIFSSEKAFVTFVTSDALALFSSTSSVIMFLSILTSRYSQEDFLSALPKKLIIGLVTLFLSIISMMIAFGTTLYLVSGRVREAWFLIPLVSLASMPVTLFASLQFPLLLNMIKSTFGPTILRKQSDRVLYLFS